MANELLSAQTSTGNDQTPQQRAFWVSKEEHVIRIRKEFWQYELGFHILKVPEYYRRPPTEYTPVAWRFGLHNREDLDITGSEGVKLSVVAGYRFADDVDGIRSFCEAVVPDPKTMLVCYGLHEMVPKLDEDEIKQVLAFDALFLATWIDMDLSDKRLWITEHGEMPNEGLFLPIFNWWGDLVETDLCTIENQVPFDLIKRAIKHINRLTNPSYEDEDHPISGANGEQVHGSSLDQLTQSAMPKERFVKRLMKCIMNRSNPEPEGTDLAIPTNVIAHPYLEQWMKRAVYSGAQSFMDLSDDFYKNANANIRLSQSDHILDATYKVICGVDGLQRTQYDMQEYYIHVPSAKKLKQSGIKIVGVAGPLCTMSYDIKTKQLSLPKMLMYDDTVALVRNIARYEEFSQENKCMFRDYIFLMLELTETAEDFKFLSTECGVIENGCGSRGFKMWDALNLFVTEEPSSEEHNAMKEAINKRCKPLRYRMWSEFKTLFLSRPWLTLSAIAAILVTVATLVQTYAAVIGTNGMKP